jgi:mono/diheme cytochrome c family protein
LARQEDVMDGQKAAGRAVASFAVAIGLTVVMTPAAAGQGQASPSKVSVTDYDMPKAAASLTLSDAELRGKKLFVQRCSLCHDLLGQPAASTVGPWVDGETVKSRGESAVREKIKTGSRRMPGFQYTFDAADIDRIVAYLKTVTPDQKPKPPRQFEVPID